MNVGHRDSTTAPQRVVFDTNVLEGRYLPALLRGEECRDFSVVRSAGFVPAVHVKSLHEICHHAKLGGKTFPWMSKDVGYPGGIERGKAILRHLPNCDVDNNVYWWFGLCEEWRDLDWEEEEARIRSLVRREDQESALVEVAIRRDFTTRKFELTAFCNRIWDAIETHLEVLVDHYADAAAWQHAFDVHREVAFNSLIPNEDLEIVVGAVLAGARAFITKDARVLQFGGLSLSLNHKTAFVHADQLREAVDNDLAFRWSRQQTSPRGAT